MQQSYHLNIKRFVYLQRTQRHGRNENAGVDIVVWLSPESENNDILDVSGFALKSSVVGSFFLMFTNGYTWMDR